MMKKLTKSLLGLIAAVAMLFAGLVAPVTALAADTATTTITVTGGAGNTYVAYKLFSATDGGDGKFAYTLNDTYKTAIIAGLKAAGQTTIADNATDATIQQSLSGLSSEAMVKFASAVYKSIRDSNLTADATSTDRNADAVFRGVAQGYYLIAQTALAEGQDAYSAVIIDTAGKDGVTVEPKKDVPTVEKKVKDINDSDSTQSDNDQWQDSADHDINDVIEYQLTGSLPDNYDSYETYKYVFTDTLSAGLTLNHLTGDTNDVKVYVKNDDTETEIKSGFNITVTGDTNNSLSAPYAGGTTLTVSFDNLKAAKGDNNADLTINSSSQIVVRYTAKLNEHAKVGVEGNPNKVDLTFSNNPTGTGEGKTPEDEVIVFTFKLTVNKVDGDKKALAGAGFSLYKYDSATGNYGENPVKQYSAGADTSFDFTGLDDGQYKLVEDEAPDGYNSIEPIEFKIVATHTQDNGNPARTLTELKIQDLDGKDMNGFTIDASKNVTATIVNKSGSELPETGGIGTTILYVAGAVCVIAAGVWFGLRRRNASR